MEKKWAIIAGCAILYITAFLLFGPIVKIILIIGAIAFGMYKFS